MRRERDSGTRSEHTRATSARAAVAGVVDASGTVPANKTAAMGENDAPCHARTPRQEDRCGHRPPAKDGRAHGADEPGVGQQQPRDDHDCTARDPPIPGLARRWPASAGVVHLRSPRPTRVTINVQVPHAGARRPGTDLSVPFDAVAGSMRAAAAPVLVALGYDDIVELDGGMVAWLGDGRQPCATT